MLFNTIEYIFLFLPIAVLGYFLLNHQHLVLAAKWWLVGSSIIFYAWWNLNNLPILLVSMLANWAIINAIWRANERSDPSAKKLFIAGLLFNLLYLGCFKYYDAIAISINHFWGFTLPVLNIALPLGISFFTLTQTAYLVDAREKLVSRQKFQDYALFVLFFPHLIIGPIYHHMEMMPQFEKLRTKVFSLENLATGMFLFGIGFAKKALIADQLAPYVSYCFDEATTLGMIEAWQAALAFTCQLYFDFSGYMDMALGSALMLNIRMPQNFNSPLRAKSIIEFWSRWHMTLTNFLTTYIYTPILYALKPVTFSKSLIAVFTTFLIAGIWHGAAWTFIIFGTLHGTALTLNHFWRHKHWPMPSILGWTFTFIFLCVSLLFFRANNLHDAGKILSSIAGLNGIEAQSKWQSIPEIADYSISLAGTGLDLKVFFLITLSIFIILTFNNSGELTAKLKKYLNKTDNYKK